jgi:hypothetical protein
MKTEAIRSFEASVNTISTLRHTPENCFLHSHRLENLKSYMVLFLIQATEEPSSMSPVIEASLLEYILGIRFPIT